MVHSTGPSLAYRLTDAAGVSIGFSGDSEMCAGLRRSIAGCDLFVCECTGWDGPTPGGHLWRDEVAGLMAENPSTRFLLSHLERAPSPAGCAGRPRPAQPGDFLGRNVARNSARRQVRSACARSGPEAPDALNSARAVTVASSPSAAPARGRARASRERQMPCGSRLFAGPPPRSPRVSRHASRRRPASAAAASRAAPRRSGRRRRRAPPARRPPTPGATRGPSEPVTAAGVRRPGCRASRVGPGLRVGSGVGAVR